MTGFGPRAAAPRFTTAGDLVNKTLVPATAQSFTLTGGQTHIRVKHAGGPIRTTLLSEWEIT
jgi:hypothetical protein